jgi:Glu-tRNA(Gln) amidotransferase subunit E-like FAD-binding protein
MLINFASIPINRITESDIKLPYNNIISYVFRKQIGGNNTFEDITKGKRERGELSSKIYAGLFISVISELKDAGLPINEVDEAKIINYLANLETIEIRLENLWKMLRSLADLVDLFGGPPEKDVPFKLSHIKKYEEVINELLKNKNDIQSCIKNNINDGQTIQNEIIKKYGNLLIESSKV